MNCKRFEIAAIELARDPSAEVGEQARAHLQSCPECAAALADQRSLTSGLRALNWNTRSVSAPPRVEAELRAAFRKAATSSPITSPAPATAKFRFRLAFAAAAVVVIAAGAFYVRERFARTSLPASSREAVVQDGARRDMDPPLVGEGKDQQEESLSPAQPVSSSDERSKASRRAGHPRENGTRSESSEAGMDFVPVIYGSDLTPLEGGQILRVRLSRSALASLGLPVNVEHPDETLMADVMLGEDGLARSIRLVESKEGSPQN
jgi:hypothetical protein